MQIILINFRKEIVPFLPKNKLISNAESPDDCSDVLIVSDSIAMVAHNEDANVALVGHTYGLLYSILFKSFTNPCQVDQICLVFRACNISFLVLQLFDKGNAVKGTILHCIHVCRRAPKLCIWIQQSWIGKNSHSPRICMRLICETQTNA